MTVAMGIYPSFFARPTQDSDELSGRVGAWLRKRRAKLRGKFVVRAWPNSPWVEVLRSDFELGGVSLNELSRALQVEVVRVAAQSAVDYFDYRHLKAGRQLRRLEYGGSEERVWSEVEGEAEEWEASTFFDGEILHEYLEAAETDAERQKIQEAFEYRVIEKGRDYPGVSAETALDNVVRHWALPGFADEPPATSLSVKGTKGSAATSLGWAMFASGGLSVLLNGLWHEKLDAIGGAGFLLLWAGSVALFRRWSGVTAFGCGFLLACVSMLTLFLLGKAF